MVKSHITRALAGAVLAGMITAAPGHADDLAVFAGHVDGSSVSVDHRALEQYLGAFTVANGGRTQIAYSAAEGRGHRFLEGYIARLGQLDPTAMDRDEQLAYWLNLRNAMVIDLASEARSQRRLNDEIGTLAAPGAEWLAPRVTVNGQNLSIQDVEAILLQNWDNPNLIYGLYQGTKDGARLPRAPFNGAYVNDALEELGRDFVGSSEMGRVRRSELQLSPVYQRYAETLFDGDQAAIISHVSSLASGRFAQKMESVTEVTFRDMKHRGESFTPRAPRLPASGGGGGVRGS